VKDASMAMTRHPPRAIRERLASGRDMDESERAEKAIRRAAAKAQHREYSSLKEGAHQADGGRGTPGSGGLPPL
jgi:hypothetical protein